MAVVFAAGFLPTNVFAETAYNVYVVVEPEDYGTVTGVNNPYYDDATASLKATPVNGYVFKGWYQGQNPGQLKPERYALLSKTNPYNFTPSENYYYYEPLREQQVNLIALFEKCEHPHPSTCAPAYDYNENEHWQTTCITCHSILDNAYHVNADGNSVCDVCGYKFPEEDISELGKPNIIETADGSITIWNRVYLGQYDGHSLPWRILDIDDKGNAYLLSDETFDMMAFINDGSGIWEDSDVRAWLNDDFTKKLGLESIARISGEIALLTKADAENPAYGFVNNAARKYSEDNDISWWLMTPDEESGNIYTVDGDGAITLKEPGTKEVYVRPAIHINLKYCSLWSHTSPAAGFSESTGKQIKVLEKPSLYGPKAEITYNGKFFNGSEVYSLPDSGIVYISKPASEVGIHTVEVKTEDGYIFADGSFTWTGQFEIKAAPDTSTEDPSQGNPPIVIDTQTTKAYTPKATAIAKLTPAKKAFTVKWKKKSCTGYQIRYSLKSSMASAKKVTVKKASTLSKKIRKLKSRKKYYVQVRTYKTVKGTKYYSRWSKKKAVKTK